ncbi:MAG TPA: hydroxymethylbilane synthase, partial [Prochlorococcaceae cyanobacterium Fu_MAG_134]|nr:hydroxymethylbilane synthase [Prochlorococcaceae cyanobacterium Fu_MAG_134]
MALNQLRIASRRSQLAMVQTNWVQAELEQAHPG